MPVTTFVFSDRYRRELPAQSGVATAVTSRLFSWVLLLGLLVALFQGAFFGVVTEWVTGREFLIFSLLPFNLYPSDLFVLPLFVGTAILAAARWATAHGREGRKIVLLGGAVLGLGMAIGLGRLGGVVPLTNAIYATDLLLIPWLALVVMLVRSIVRLPSALNGRGRLLLGWWLIFLYGSIVGALNGAPDLLGDVRGFMVRPIVAVAAYFIALQSDLKWVILRFIRIGVLIATILAISSLLQYIGGGSNLGLDGTYGGLALLAPYGLLLASLMANKTDSRSLFGLGLLALGILAPLAKPIIGGFLILNLIAFLSRPRLAVQSSGSAFRTLLLLGAVIGLLYVLLFSGGTSIAEDHIRTAYLKEDAAVQDLSGSRLSIWQLGIKTWTESPLIGTGIGYMLQGETLNLTSGQYIYSAQIWTHNIAVQVLFQLGLIGTFLLLAISLKWLRVVFRESGLLSGSYQRMHYGVLVVALTYVLMALYGQFITQSISGFLLWIMLGLEPAIVQLDLAGKSAQVNLP